MATKLDITSATLPEWNQYKEISPEDAAKEIYEQISGIAKSITAWYWTSIHSKRSVSLATRGLAFLGLVFGTALPILAALQKTDLDRLAFTQWGVALLAIGGLCLVADRVFGWSSGWMRYITTVTTMENLIRAFQLEWGSFFVSKSQNQLVSADAMALYELAVKLEQELTKLQAEETTKWCAEFNTGISLLEAMVKTQREETDKKLDSIRTSLTTQQQAAKAEEKSMLPGAIEISITHKDLPKKLLITLDKQNPREFLGTVCSIPNIEPGMHLVRIQTEDVPPFTLEHMILVTASSITRIDIKLP